MQYDPRLHHRRSIRLKGHDYASAGAYFVTMVTHGKRCLFGEVVGGVMRLNVAGRIVAEEWLRSAQVRSEVTMDAFVVMPNHIHGIVVIDRPTPTSLLPADLAIATAAGPRSRSIGALVAGFKAAASRRIHACRGGSGPLVWQRNYYEHIVRDEVGLGRIRQYIADNPARWRTKRPRPDRDQRARE